MAVDRFNVNVSLSKNFEHLQNKFVGTGHPDITVHEWATNQHRDSNSTFVGHHDLLTYLAVGGNVANGRMKYEILGKMLQPCGPPPADKDASLKLPIELEDADPQTNQGGYTSDDMFTD